MKRPTVTRTRVLQPEDQLTADRRRHPAHGRRATDAFKMACPHCGASESLVMRSRAGIIHDSVRRRRLCSECGQRFPTSERVDRELLERELADTPAAPRVFAPPPATWDNAEALLHRVWGDAKDRDYVKSDWLALQAVLTELRRAQA